MSITSINSLQYKANIEPFLNREFHKTFPHHCNIPATQRKTDQTENLLYLQNNFLLPDGAKQSNLEYIAQEYERLQQKYCKNFKRPTRINVTKLKTIPMKRIATNIAQSCQKTCAGNQSCRENFLAGSSQRLAEAQNKNMPKSEKSCSSPRNAHVLSNWNKTLTVHHLNQNKVPLDMAPATKSGLTTKLIPSQQEILYPQLQGVFYHHNMPVNNTSYEANNHYNDKPPCESKLHATQRKSSGRPKPAAANLITPKIQLQKDLRQAIILGKSADVVNNKLLANAIKKANAHYNYSFNTVQSIIKGIKDFHSHQKVLHLLQIELKHKVFILCTVRTCNFANLLALLDKALHRVQAIFTNVLQHFSHVCIIQACVPNEYFKFPSQKLRRHLNWDAEFLKAKRISVTDETSGEVCVQCEPDARRKVTQTLERRGYKVFNSHYDFRANKEISLDTATANKYRSLLKSLAQLEDIETIVDNVAY